MAPRDSAPEAAVVVDDSLKSTTSMKHMEERDLSKPPTGWQTFHHELNVYSFGVLYWIYQTTGHSLFWSIFAAIVTLDAANYYYKKGSMAGVPYTLPFVSLVAMIVHPVRFWTEMANIAMQNDGFCTQNMVGNFMVFCTDPDASKKVFNAEGTWQLYAHPNAYWLFGPKNLIYLDTEVHKKCRAILTPALFSEPALLMYAKAQEKVCRHYLEQFSQQAKTDARVAFRIMAAASSQESFLGPYLDDALRTQLTEDIQTFTMGFLSFPFPYLFGLGQAIRAKNRIEDHIRGMVPRARDYVLSGKEPRCMLEYWMLQICKTANDMGVGHQDIPCCSDDDVALTVLDFLFAAQDATNSGLTYTLDVLDAHRDVWERVRAEVDTACGKQHTVGETLRTTSKLDFCSKVANKMLHHKPPVPMVPHLALKDAEVNGYQFSKGSVMIPSITYSTRVSGQSLGFDVMENDDAQFVKCPTFGGGQHKCPGRRYAESLLAVFVGVLAQNYDFSRTGPRPSADEFIYYPTVFPSDSDFVLTARQQ